MPKITRLEPNGESVLLPFVTEASEITKELWAAPLASWPDKAVNRAGSVSMTTIFVTKGKWPTTAPQ